MFASNPVSVDFDLDDILGQEDAKRTTEVAAAAGHNLLKGQDNQQHTLPHCWIAIR